MADCDFHGQEDYHLAIQLACGCNTQEAQLKLLTEPNIDLAKFQSILEAQESSSLDTNRLRGGLQVAAAFNRYDDRRSQYQRYDRQQQPAPVNQKGHQQLKPEPQAPCSGCGRTGHFYKSAQCPAYGRKCSFCRSLHHNEGQCRKKKAQKQHKSFKSLHIGSFGSSSQPKFVHTVHLQKSDGTLIAFTADTDSCSDLSGISHKMYAKDFADFKLKPQTEPVHNFDGSEITGVYGSFDTSVHFQGRQKKLTLYVLPEKLGSVIGKNLIFGLNMVLDPAQHICSASHLEHSTNMEKTSHEQHITVEAIASALEPPAKYAAMLQKFPNLSKEGIGLVPGFEHYIELQKGATPTVSKLRSIPFSRREKALKEIDLMEQQGIWKKVDRSNWVLPLVTVDKPNGDCRITTDFTPLNKFVIPVRYPFPHIRELHTKFRKATLFSKLDMTKYFYNIGLNKECQLFTTTLTPKGMYAYNCLPMGLTDSAAVAQKVIAKVLSGCHGCEPYMDDIIIFG